MGFGIGGESTVHGALPDLAGLVHAVDGGQQLAGGIRGVPHGRRVQAVVAVAAGGGFFAKVGQ